MMKAWNLHKWRVNGKKNNGKAVYQKDDARFPSVNISHYVVISPTAKKYVLKAVITELDMIHKLCMKFSGSDDAFKL